MKKRQRRPVWWALIIGGALSHWAVEADAQETADLLRDTWGIPHVFAESRRGMYYAAGWATAEDEAELLLIEVLKAEGRFSRTRFGEADFQGALNDDIIVRGLQIGEQAQADYDLLSPEVREALDAFAEGFNAYVAAHPTWPFRELEPQEIEPVSGWQLAAVAIADNIRNALQHLSDEEKRPLEDVLLLPEPNSFIGGSSASNAAAIHAHQTDPEHGSALYGDPHSGWDGARRQMHLVDSGNGVEIFAPFSGPYAGGGVYRKGTFWYALGGTNNFPDPGDVYKETVQLQPTGYEYLRYPADQGTPEWKPVVVRTATFPLPDGDAMVQTYYYTERGWVSIFRYGEAPYEYRSFRLSTNDVGNPAAPSPIHVVEQRVRMSWSVSMDDVMNIIGEPQFAHRSMLVATAQDILYTWYGRIAVRGSDDIDYTKTLIPSTGNKWQDGVYLVAPVLHHLPYVLNPQDEIPANTWLQNSNDAPWMAVPNATGIPYMYLPGPNVAPSWIVKKYTQTRFGHLGATARGMRLRELLLDTPTFSDDLLKALAFDTVVYHAREFMNAVLAIWDDPGQPSWDDYVRESYAGPDLADDMIKMHDALRDWVQAGAHADIDATGMTIMAHLVGNASLPQPDNVDESYLIETYIPRLAVGREDMVGYYEMRFPDPLLVPWGDVHFVEVVSTGVAHRVPLPGGTNVISALMMGHRGSGGFTGSGDMPCTKGSTHIHGHVFSSNGYPGSWSVTPQGQMHATYFPDSPHRLDQLTQMGQKNWIRNLFTRDEVEQNLTPYEGQHGHVYQQRTELTIP